MSGPDWYRWFPSKWLSGTLALTPEQRGVYIQIVNVILDRGECPADEDYLMRLCNCHRRRLRRIITELEAAQKIHLSGCVFEQKRAKLERKESETFTELQRNRALKRWKNNKMDDPISGNANHNHTIDSESYSTSESKNQPSVCSRGVRGGTARVRARAPNGAGEKAKPSKKRRAVAPIPDDWTPDLDFARSKGMSAAEINGQANRLLDWARANDKRYADWQAVWRNWVRSYVERKETHH